jgi:DNA mismatch repair protein MutL
MVGKFPACVLHLRVPANAVDVNVHPAKTEVKFLSEKTVFDCVHYGVLGALNRTPDRPQVQFTKAPPAEADDRIGPKPKQDFFRTMTPSEYKTFSSAIADAPKPNPQAAVATVAKLERPVPAVQERILIPQPAKPVNTERPCEPVCTPAWQSPKASEQLQEIAPSAPAESPDNDMDEVIQEQLPMPAEIPWRMVGELYNSYILVEEGENAYLIDKHAAHERILFDKLKANQESITAQALLTPIPVRLSAEAAAELLSRKALLDELGFEVEEFGENTVLLRQIPMDLSPDDAAEAAEALAADLLSGRHDTKDTVRDEILHTVACKAAIKAGWRTDEKELLALVKQVMSREDLKHCPHGRPICITLSKKQLEKQFKRA